MKKTIATLMLLAGGSFGAHAAIIDTTRDEIFNTGTKTHGSHINTGTADGENWEFRYVSATDTGYSSVNALNYDSGLFGGVYGNFHTGMGSATPFLTFGASFNTPHGAVVMANPGYQNASISGTLGVSGTTAGFAGFLDWNWATIAYDTTTNMISTLASGGFRTTSDGASGQTISNLSGDGITVSGSATLDEVSDWIGLVYWKSGQLNSGGNHFNLLDSGITYSMESDDAAVPLPGVLALMGPGLVLLRRKAW